MNIDGSATYPEKPPLQNVRLKLRWVKYAREIFSSQQFKGLFTRPNSKYGFALRFHSMWAKFGRRKFTGH